MDRIINKILIGVFIFLCLWLIFYAFTFPARMEARQFNRFSKTKITWWDAMWADYRILPDR